MCSVWPRSNRARPLIVVCGGQVLGGSLGNAIENDYSVGVRRQILIMVLSRQAMRVVVNALGHVMAAYELSDKFAHESHCNPVNPAIESRCLYSNYVASSNNLCLLPSKSLAVRVDVLAGHDERSVAVRA